MTKRLIAAAEAVIENTMWDSSGLTDDMQAALNEARQPVTVTPDQAVELILTFHRVADGAQPTQEETDRLTAHDKLEIAAVMTAVLQNARELGL